MKRSELIDELNSALFDDREGKRYTNLIQTTLTWEQWEELAPYMNYDYYKFEKLFEHMADDEWENNEELQDLAWHMAECANYITAVLIDPYDHDCANVICYTGLSDKNHDYKELYNVVNV